MKRFTGFKILLGIVLLLFFVQIAAADDTNVMRVTAEGTSVGCTAHTPGNYVCGPFQINSPDIHVTQSGTSLTASEVDGNGNPFTLNGNVNGNTVTFTIQGIGFTPGIGPATTIYTGTLNGNVITGSFSGSASWTYDAGNGNMVTETATWTGTFIAIITTPDASFMYLPTNPTIINTVTFTPNIEDNDNKYTYLWQSSDGASATTRLFEHQYTKIGNYKVNLTVTNSLTISTKTEQEIKVLCGGLNPRSTRIEEFLAFKKKLDADGCLKNKYTSESGEIIKVCKPVLDEFLLTYKGPICGNIKKVGGCDFNYGDNYATITWVDNNNNGEPDCFLSTNWITRDYGPDDYGDGKLDWNVYDFSVNTCTVSPTHRLFEYPYPCGGNLPLCVVWNKDMWNFACTGKSVKDAPFCNRNYIYKKPEGPEIL
jgi:hypothetical protein